MSPDFWQIVLTAPAAEFEAIMGRLEEYERRKEEERREWWREKIQRVIEDRRRDA